MKNLTTFLCLTLAVLSFSGTKGASGDVKKSLDAYDKRVYETALRKLKPLDEQEDANVQFVLGVSYYYGKGVPQNYKTAVKWYTLAANQGHLDTKYRLKNL